MTTYTARRIRTQWQIFAGEKFYCLAADRLGRLARTHADAVAHIRRIERAEADRAADQAAMIARRIARKAAEAAAKAAEISKSPKLF